MTAPPWPNQTGAPFPGVDNENVASGNAHVDQQIGAHYGDTAFHRYEIYNINQSDPPDRKYQVAINHLEGGTARFAEEILSDLLRAGHTTSRLTYYYALAVLSGRSLNEIDKTVFRAFNDACRAAARFPFDTWQAALEVVRQLMSSVWRQESDPASLQHVLDNFAALPPARRAEITRHLDMILSGAIQDRLDALDAERVEHSRMDADRAGRAWKFFEPDPAPPRQFHPTPAPIDGQVWLRVGLGGVALLLGVLLTLSQLGQGNPAATMILLVIGLGGGYLAMVNGIDRQHLTNRLTRKNREHGLPYRPQPPVSPGHWVRTDFVTELHDRVDTEFRRARPHIAGSWENDTRGCREHLKARLVLLYGNARVTPGAITWLIRWHANQIGARWRAGSLFDYRVALLPSTRTNVLFGLGLAAAVVGLLGVAIAGSVVAALFLGPGGYHTASGIVGLIASRRHDADHQAENEQIFADEQRAYADWVETLRDRPTDAEMARWLDLDKSYLKMSALRRCGLTNRDLVAHVVLTEGAPHAMRARVVHGPARYSAYVVLVFLLTQSGVREIEVDLDFLTGAVRDERRTSFRYDTLASARVSEVGVRHASDRRYVTGPNDPAPPEAAIRSRTFNLSLLNGEDITVIVENFKGLADPEVEDASRLLQIALDTSGIAGALHILETVAAEGRDWIAREQERRQRRAQDWQSSDHPDLAGSDLASLFPSDTPTQEEPMTR